MPQREPPNKGDMRSGRPRWSSPLWYLPIMFLLLWLWQTTVTQFAYRNIPYSEFKERVARGEVTEARLGDEIVGSIRSNSKLSAITNATPNLPPDFNFRTTPPREGDPNPRAAADGIPAGSAKLPEPPVLLQPWQLDRHRQHLRPDQLDQRHTLGFTARLRILVARTCGAGESARRERPRVRCGCRDRCRFCFLVPVSN